ncbi:hypothetical protein [Sphingomonas sp.]|uniref:hypothetical protein n=1 Tax=Sphingomonas sp. TaxID=28214 RepID=UPI003AFFA78F
MTSLTRLMLLAGATLAAPAMAQTPAAHPATTHAAATTRPAATHTATTTRPAAAHMATTTSTTTRRPAAPAGRMVTAKLANGKSVTYNCSLAGNANKTACKRG